MARNRLADRHPTKLCAVCARRAVRLRQNRWTCTPCWRMSQGKQSKFAREPVPAAQLTPRRRTNVGQHMPKMSSDRALVLRRCCEAGRGVGELAYDVLDTTYTAARALAARMLKAELLCRSRADGHFVYSATRLGRARLRKHDRRIERIAAQCGEGANQ